MQRGLFPTSLLVNVEVTNASESMELKLLNCWEQITTLFSNPSIYSEARVCFCKKHTVKYVNILNNRLQCLSMQRYSFMCSTVSYTFSCFCRMRKAAASSPPAPAVMESSDGTFFLCWFGSTCWCWRQNKDAYTNLDYFFSHSMLVLLSDWLEWKYTLQVSTQESVTDYHSHLPCVKYLFASW